MHVFLLLFGLVCLILPKASIFVSLTHGGSTKCTQSVGVIEHLLSGAFLTFFAISLS